MEKIQTAKVIKCSKHDQILLLLERAGNVGVTRATLHNTCHYYRAKLAQLSAEGYQIKITGDNCLCRFVLNSGNELDSNHYGCNFSVEDGYCSDHEVYTQKMFELGN